MSPLAFGKVYTSLRRCLCTEFTVTLVWLEPWNIATRDIHLGAPCIPTPLPAWQPYVLWGAASAAPASKRELHSMDAAAPWLSWRPARIGLRSVVGIWDLSSIQSVVTHRKKHTQGVIWEYFHFSKFLLFACCYKGNLKLTLLHCLVSHTETTGRRGKERSR